MSSTILPLYLSRIVANETEQATAKPRRCEAGDKGRGVGQESLPLERALAARQQH